MYEDYYTGQVGGNVPVFRGMRHQRGHGLGNVIGGLFRRVVLPFLKKEQKGAHQKCDETGMEVADDVLEGQSLKSSVKKRLPQGIKRAAGDMDWQTGSGFRKRRKTRDAQS